MKRKIKTMNKTYNNAVNIILNTKGVFLVHQNLSYLNIIYRGYQIYVQANNSGIDEKHPGEVLFLIREICPNGMAIRQASYYVAFQDMSSIDDYLDTHKIKAFEDATARHLDPNLSFGLVDYHIDVTKEVRDIVNKNGGDYEKKIMSQRFFITTDERDPWNKKNKKLKVWALYPQNDTYVGFTVDLQTHSICESLIYNS